MFDKIAMGILENAGLAHHITNTPNLGGMEASEFEFWLSCVDVTTKMEYIFVKYMLLCFSLLGVAALITAAKWFLTRY